MEIIALTLAIIAFGLCFIVWVIPIIGPGAVLILSIIAIVLSVISMISISNFNRNIVSNIDENNHVMPKKNTKTIISMIIGIVSFLIAMIFLILHIFLIVNFTDNIEFSSNQMMMQGEMMHGEYNQAYEIEDDLFLTIESATYTDGQVTLNYSLQNKSNQEGVIYVNNFYYTTSENIDEEIYPYKNTLTPIYIEANAVYVSETISFPADTKPDTIGYNSINEDSVEFKVE